MLTLILVIPIIGSIIILLQSHVLNKNIALTSITGSIDLNESTATEQNELKMKEIALTTSLINLFVSLILWYQFDSNITQFQFVSEFNQLNYFHLNFGIDGLSIYFVLLTTFITPIAILSNYTNITKNLKLFLISMLILESLQICAFVSLDLLLFYIFFESAKWSGISLLCLQLSNSGDALKLIVPSYSRKAISGWSNYSGKVTSYKMIENEMGYRGSKSDTAFLLENKIVSVKEQRVDGSYLGSLYYPKLRCTLMGGESRYQFSIPSNQFLIQTNKQIKNFHTNSKLFIHQDKAETKNLSLLELNKTSIKPLLNPWFITGFIDAEGCFGLYLYKNTAMKNGWSVFLDFKITLHKKDEGLLNQIQNYFGVGSVFKHGEFTTQYGLKSIKDMQIIIAHFDKFPLLTQKVKDYRLFKKAYNIIIIKEHLTKEGLDKLIAIKYFMNNGLSPKLIKEFSHINPETIITEEGEAPNLIIDSNWISGFSSGDGSFQVDIKKNNSIKGYQVLLRFSIGQHSRDKQLLNSFIDYLDCGNVYKKINNKSNKEFFEFRVEKFSDIDTKIIPFFINFPILGIKLLDFQDFCKIAKLMKDKVHLTEEGLNNIRKIKNGMNTGRIL